MRRKPTISNRELHVQRWDLSQWTMLTINADNIIFLSQGRLISSDFSFPQ